MRALIGFLASLIALTFAPMAWATPISVPNPTTKVLFDACVADFNLVGKGQIITDIEATGKTVTVTNDAPKGTETVPTHYSDKENVRDGSTGADSTVRWKLPATDVWVESYGTCAEDKCATLYHELYHAYRQAKGTDFNRTPCRTDTTPKYPLDTAEVEATRAENEYQRRRIEKSGAKCA